MRDLVVNIEDEMFVFNITGYQPSEESTPMLLASTGTVTQTVEPSVTETAQVEEIMLLRAAAKEAMNGTR